MSERDLRRFLDAQDQVVRRVTAELSVGRKQSHWMWFIFPQLAGLGRSETARFYGIADLEEARRYLSHPVLGERLRHHVQLMMNQKERTARQVLGEPDDIKFRSCLTLFLLAAKEEPERSLFESALEQFYGGELDPRTLTLLECDRAPRSNS